MWWQICALRGRIEPVTGLKRGDGVSRSLTRARLRSSVLFHLVWSLFISPIKFISSANLTSSYTISS